MIELNDVQELVKEIYGEETKRYEIKEITTPDHPIGFNQIECEIIAQTRPSLDNPLGQLTLKGKSWDDIFFPIEGQLFQKIAELKDELSDAEAEHARVKDVLAKYK